jgi:serine/threonine-protein kinase
MSPEQARGKAVDKRADIWAFGAVLFEMLTSRRAFAGEDITDTIVSVVSREPDWGALPAPTPVGLRRVLTRCLKKDARVRMRDIGEARVAERRVAGGDDSLSTGQGSRRAARAIEHAPRCCRLGVEERHGAVARAEASGSPAGAAGC